MSSDVTPHVHHLTIFLSVEYKLGSLRTLADGLRSLSTRPRRGAFSSFFAAAAAAAAALLALRLADFPIHAWQTWKDIWTLPDLEFKCANGLQSIVTLMDGRNG